MKSSVVLLLSAVGLALADGHKDKAAVNGTMSVEKQCDIIDNLQEIVTIANNATLLAKASKGNATKAAEITAKASAATAQIANMTAANATLMGTCNQIFAVDNMKDDCENMVSMQKLAALVANDTALAAKTNNNATKAQMLKDKVNSQKAKLDALQSNTTLTTFCSSLATKSSCKQAVKYTKMIANAANATWLNETFKGNTAKMDKYKAEATKAQTKLTTLQSNSTLMGICGNTSLATTGAQTAGSSGGTSGAVAYQPVGAMVALGALVFGFVLLL